jgi:Protein of unknown function (DUF1826)
MKLALVVLLICVATLVQSFSVGRTAMRQTGKQGQSLNVAQIEPVAAPAAVAVQVDSQGSSVTTIETRTEFTDKVWEALVPSLWEKGGGVDVRYKWTAHEDIDAVASNVQEILRRLCKKDLSSTAPIMQNDLVQSITQFTKYCSTHLDSVDTFTLRLLSTRGKTGTKCPVWHFDHVPVRWVQSFVGPGCQWANNVNWEAVNAVEAPDSTPRERNRLIVSNASTIHTANTGEAVLLVGTRWNEFSAIKTSIMPAVHKSPELQPWEGRVLLVMDVVVPFDD